METITKRNTSTERFVAEFESSSADLFGKPETRKQAMESFLKQGIPGRKHEEYRYLNMEQTLKGDFAFSAPLADSALIGESRFLKNAIRIVLLNGMYSAEHSAVNDLPAGLTICGLAEAAQKHFAIVDAHFAIHPELNADPFAALNIALAKDGVFIHVAKNAVIETPVHIIHICDTKESAFLNSHNLIVAEERSQVSIVESYSGKGAQSFHNSFTAIHAAADSNVDHYKIQDEGDAGQSVNTTLTVQKKNSVLSTGTFTFSGALVRNNLNMLLEAENVEAHLNGLYLAKGSQVIDNHTLVDHRMPNCNSNELYKGIIDDRSSATFNGKIFVRKDAQKTNAFQSNKNILLSDDGTINTKPQLEIYADDVKCSHGTSTGKLDEDKIFYLRARGLSEMSAKKMLMHAFASEVADTIKIAELREYVDGKIAARFE